MPAIVAGIHAFLACSVKDVDGRDKPGHDAPESASGECAVFVATELSVALEQAMTRRVVRLDGIVPVARGYPAAVVANGFAFIGGVRGSRADHTPRFDDLPEQFRRNGFSGLPIPDADEGAFAADGWGAHDNLDRVVKAVGSDPLQVLRQHIWLADKRRFPVYERIRMAWQQVPAPSSCLGVAEVAGRFGRFVGLEAFAVVPGENPLFPNRTTTRAFDNKEFPSAGFYSQAVRCGPLIFLAGHIPIETRKAGAPVIAGFADIPDEGRFLATGRSHPDSRQGPIAAQTWFTYERIRENLAAQGLTMRDIKHVAVMLQDIRDFGTFHRVHMHFFPDNPPALMVTGFDEVGHRGTLIEIEPTAVDPRAGLPVTDIAWPQRAPFAGPAAVKLGPVTFFAGILGLNNDGALVSDARDLDDAIGRRVAGDLARFERAPGFAAQCWAAWRTLAAVCERGGLALERLAKTTVYLRSGADLWIYEEIREAFLSGVGRHLPAAEFVAIRGPGPVDGAQVQIEAMAADG
jgi:enamine deaminase RidA (YjgF/YER057c/UK114 family)